MKSFINASAGLFVLLAMILLMITGCKKENEPLTVTDADGNVYKTVVIGTQTWMAGNLKTTKYNDGSEIPLVTNNTSWTNQKTPGYCYYDNNDANKDPYGALYNWYAIDKGNLCPAGWRVPSKADWTTLISYLGGEDVAGLELKEKGTIHWDIPNDEVTNSTGFSALPGGLRFGQGGLFGYIRTDGYYWSSTPDNILGESAWYFELYHEFGSAYVMDQYMRNGMSVRCIKN